MTTTQDDATAIEAGRDEAATMTTETYMIHAFRERGGPESIELILSLLRTSSLWSEDAGSIMIVGNRAAAIFALKAPGDFGDPDVREMLDKTAQDAVAIMGGADVVFLHRF